MKTKLMLAAAVLAAFAAPACAEMSGIPPEMQFWLLQTATPAVHVNASWVNSRGLVLPSVPGHEEIMGIPKELLFWVPPPTVAAAEATVRQPRTTTGQGLPAADVNVRQPRTTTGEGLGVPYPRPRTRP